MDAVCSEIQLHGEAGAEAELCTYYYGWAMVWACSVNVIRAFKNA